MSRFKRGDTVICDVPSDDKFVSRVGIVLDGAPLKEGPFWLYTVLVGNDRREFLEFCLFPTSGS